MIEPTDEMRRLVKARMGVPDGACLDPWMEAAIGDVLALVERDLTARVEGERDSGLCDCACDDEPVSPRTGLPMSHHCDCRAVTTAGVLLGGRRKTKHVAECSCDWDEP